ncbi:MAG: sulfurtransferase TusA family protein [Myxococcales bacterium]|nr:sulfurtransferase TusA family protein [Myxococcales bacterium]
MPIVPIDMKGVRCPGPQLRLTTMLLQQRMKDGDTAVVTGDCPEFEQEMKSWCERWDKTLVSLRQQPDGMMVAEILI